MAGSLNHITNDNGTFDMATIENMGDAHEALEECDQIIAYLLRGLLNGAEVLARACEELSFPRPAHVPVIQLELLPRHAPLVVRSGGGE